MLWLRITIGVLVTLQVVFTYAIAAEIIRDQSIDYRNIAMMLSIIIVTGALQASDAHLDN